MHLPYLTNDGSGSIFCGSGRVSHLWLGFEFGKFPLKTSNISIFCPSGQKKSLWVGSESTRVGGGSPLIYCRSKVSSGRVESGRVRAHLYTWLETSWKNLILFTFPKFIFVILWSLTQRKFGNTRLPNASLPNQVCQPCKFAQWTSSPNLT